MTKIDYIKQLDALLVRVETQMRTAIIKQYEVLFDESLANDDSEEAIIKRTGTPKFVADYYMETLDPKYIITMGKSDTTTETFINPQPVGVGVIRGLFVGLGLLLFNLVIVLAPYIVVWSLLISFFAIGIALSASGIVVVIASVISLPFMVNIPILFMSNPVLLISSSVILISLGFIFLLLVAFASKYFALWSVVYIKWTISMIRGDAYVQ